MMPLCEMLASSAARARPKSVIFTLLLTAFEQHVARLDVAMDQVGRVGGGQPLGDLPADPQHLRHVERADPVEPLLERLAGDELHHQVGQRLLGDLVHLHHVLVADLRRRPGLAQEALAGRRGGGQLRGQDLDRHHALQHLVERPEDDAEAALAEHLEHLVVPEPAERVGPGGRGQEPQPSDSSSAGRFRRHGIRPAMATVSSIDRSRPRSAGRRVVQEAGRLDVGGEQGLDPPAEPGVPAASPVQVGGSGGRHRSCRGRRERCSSLMASPLKR